MKFLQGTYGFDFLSIFLILLGSILNLWHITYFLGIIITVYAIYRAFSKNHYIRRKEYDVFKLYTNKILNKFGKSIPNNMPNFDLNSLTYLVARFNRWFSEKQQYKICKCPKCSQKLRLPRRKGKLIVTCKKCGNKFDFKT